MNPFLRISILIAVFLSIDAYAQTKSAFTVPELTAALSKAGISTTILDAKLDNASFVQGTVKSEKGEFTFYVRPNDCGGSPVACNSFVFFTNFELGRESSPQDLSMANSYNDTRVFGRAYVLEPKKQVGVDFVIEFTGGVTDEFVIKSGYRWLEVLNNFVDHFRKSTAKK